MFSNPTASGAAGSVLIVGAIGDHGKYVQVNATQTPDPNGSYMKVRLHNGTFEVRFTAATVRHKTPFKATCSGVFSERTPSAVLNGTGHYTGISGTLEFTATHVLLSSRHTSGPDAGQCNHADVIAEYTSVGASGLCGSAEGEPPTPNPDAGTGASQLAIRPKGQSAATSGSPPLPSSSSSPVRARFATPALPARRASRRPTGRALGCVDDDQRHARVRN